jgi:beta-glucosidase
MTAEETRSAKSVVSEMTPLEKASLLAGLDDWTLPGAPRLGVPSIRVTDCGHGVTLCGDRSSPATCFPTAVGMASTWNEALIERVGEALGRETRALGCSMLLAPMVNLHRLPVNGRSFETFSEDPVLAGRLGGAMIRGIQSQGVAACLKAMAANNQQQDQERIDVRADERTLRELYLRAFQIAAELGCPAALMTSYNRLNGDYTSESRWMIRQVIKGDWEFPGVVLSDWRSVRSARVYQSGLDLEMPGPGKFFNRASVLEALGEGLLQAEDLDDKALRIVRLLMKYGRPPSGDARCRLDSPEHRALALEVAEESIVLLKNTEAALPLDRRKIRRLLVIGPNAAEARLGGGGSASVTPFYSISPLDGIRELCEGTPVEIEYQEGCSLVGTMQPVRDCFEHPEAGGSWRPGLLAEFFNSGRFGGSPDAGWAVPEVNFSWGWAAPGPDVLRGNYCVRFSGRIVPPVSGRYRIGFFGQEGCLRMRLGGEIVIEDWPVDATFEDDYRMRYFMVEREFAAGVPVEIVAEYGKRAARGGVRIEWEVPGQPDPLARAVRSAASADAVVVCAGLSNLLEGGAMDRRSIDLPQVQQDLIAAVAAANPRTIVVLNNGGPLAMPWEPDVSAILEAWYPGQEGGRAVARILFGEANPSGKLPDTLARRLDDHLAMKNYPGDGEHVVYAEGLFVGYRHFDSAGIEPHYPFGFGLGYTTFEISAPELNCESVRAGDGLIVRGTVRNTGSRAGGETVQVYVRPITPPVTRPPKELRGFQKFHLQPGGQAEWAFALTARDFSYFCAETGTDVVAPGRYEILVGADSRNLKGAMIAVV